MGYYAEMVDGDFRIAAEKVPAALAAVDAAFDEYQRGAAGEYKTLSDAVEDLTCFEHCEEGPEGFTLGAHNDKYLGFTDELLGLLGTFAVEGSYVRFHGEDGTLFGFRVLDGRLRQESGDYTWNLDPVRPGVEGQVAV